MSGTIGQAVLWMAAAALLVLYLKRRRSRRINP